MHKKLIMLSLCFVTNSVLAGQIYTGNNVGYDATNFYKTLSIVNTTEQTLYDKKDNLSGNGYTFGALLGYALRKHSYYFAVEGAYNINTLKYHGYFNDHENNLVSYATFTLDNSFGMSVLPGYQLNDRVLLYTRLGVLRGRFHYEEYKVNGGSRLGLSENHWLTGIQYGLGVQTKLSEKFHLRFEGSQTRYESYQDNTFPLAPGQIRTITIRPQTTQVILGLIYQFN